jgi:deazaflavin-dependent oxidoreductase (nitroreductase family)
MSTRPPRLLLVLNRLNIVLLRCGIGPRAQHLLTVAGRKTGRPRTTPVAVLTFAGKRYLVAGYPSADWVHNVRAAGEATLTRGRRREHVMLTDAPPDDRAPVLREFGRRMRGGRSLLARGDNPVFLVEPR